MAILPIVGEFANEDPPDGSRLRASAVCRARILYRAPEAVTAGFVRYAASKDQYGAGALDSHADAASPTVKASPSSSDTLGRHELPPLSTVLDAPMTSSVVGNAVRALGYPDWAYHGTPYAGSRKPMPPLVTAAVALQIARNIERHVGDPCLYFRLNRTSQLPLDVSLSLALAHAPTLLDGLRAWVDYANAVMPLFEFSLERTDELLEWTVRPRVEIGDQHRTAVEGNIDLVYRYVESRRGLDLKGAVVCFAHGPAVREADYAEWLRCDIRFHAGRNSICIPSHWGGLPAPRADHGLWLLARGRAAAECAALREPGKIREIRAAIAHRLAQRQAPRLKQIAADCGVSTRTLIRTLGLADTTYYELVDGARRARAIELIMRPDISLAQIARELGFPDRSSFGRRFRAWFGDSPARFRRDTGCLPLYRPGSRQIEIWGAVPQR